MLREEVAFKLCEDLVKDPDTFLEKIEGDRNIIQKLLDFIKEVMNSIAIFRKKDKTIMKIAEQRLVQFMRGEVGEAQSSSDVKYSAKDTNSENTVINGVKIKYSLAVNAGLEVDRVLADKFYRSEVKLRDNTPQVLLDHSVKDLPMLMSASHLRENILSKEQAAEMGLKTSKNINYHGLGKELLHLMVKSSVAQNKTSRDTIQRDFLQRVAK